MKISKEEFKKLQGHWYKRLESEGFKDIEKRIGDEFALKELSSSRHRKRNAEQDDEIHRMQREAKKQYHEKISALVSEESTSYRTEIDWYILSRYADGARIAKIVIELGLLGIPRERNTVASVIRRYEVQCGITTHMKKRAPHGGTRTILRKNRKPEL